MAFVFNKSTPATGAVAVYELKGLLKTAGWTVLSSSDGTTYNAAGDQITTGASGAGGMANNSAWFRIQSPVGAGGQQFIFQRGTVNTGWKIKRSRTSGFTGGSPSATQVPSATDEVTILGGGTDASPTFATWFGIDGLYRWNVGADNASPYGFWAGSFPTGGGNPAAFLCVDPLFSTNPSDADQFWMHAAVSGQNGCSSSTIMSEAGTSTTSRNLSQIISAAPGSSYAEFPGCSYNIGANVVIPGGLPTNPISIKDEAFPIIIARRSALAIPGYKGITTILRWVGISRTTGDTLTLSTTRDRIIYRDISLPWDGSVPSV